MTRSLRRPRGFTLIELMVVVAIIGLLSSVAIPVFRRATLRTRVAERSTLMQAMKTGIEDAFVRTTVPPGGLFGAPNPAGPLLPSKRPFLNSAAGWREINILVQGNTYYRYWFQAVETSGGNPASYLIMAEGDLDGDGNQTWKQIFAQRVNGYWNVFPTPPDGEEDEVWYGTF